jgi:heptosyltransferase-3
LALRCSLNLESSLGGPRGLEADHPRNIYSYYRDSPFTLVLFAYPRLFVLPKVTLPSSHHDPAGAPTPGRGHNLLRHVDKYAGVPLVFLAGILRRRRMLPKTLKRVGVLNSAAIGDTILMSGPLADLCRAFSRTQLFVLVGPSNHEIAKLLNLPVEVIRLPVFDPISALRQIRRLNLDLLIDLGPWPRLNALFAAFSKAKFTVGFMTRGQYRHYAYDRTVEHSERQHELDNYRQLIGSLGVSCSHAPHIGLPELGKVDSTPAYTEPYVLFHLWPGGSASRLKEWPADRWAKIAEYFVGKGYRVLLSGSPEQQASNDQMIERLKPQFRSAVTNNAGIRLRETAALITGAKLVISIDTGIMHLAAALHTPVLALMGPACNRRWGPVGNPVWVVESPLKGCCYLNLGFEIPRIPPKCMEAISLEAVLGICEQVISADATSPAAQGFTHLSAQAK